MAAKYVQKVIPSVTTTRLRGFTLTELRKEALRLYEQYCANRICRNKHIGIPIQFKNSGGRKTARGEAIYSKKVAIIRYLPSLVENATYNNFGKPKEKDAHSLIGYYNFKAYVFIDGKKECIRLSVKARVDGSFYYNVEVNKPK